VTASPCTTTAHTVPVTIAQTPLPEYEVTGPTQGVTAIPDPAAGDGDSWAGAGGYRVARKWVEKYPHLYGPAATDPDYGLGNEELTDDLLAKLFARVSGEGGIFSTSAEQHCFETAAAIAYNFVESSDDIPPVPAFWTGEGHYWLMGITAGRLLKKKAVAETAAAACSTLAGLLANRKVAGIAAAALAAGGVVLPPFIQACLKVIGGS
jgi:hypothetical protein